jgi:hypothetical protein
MSCNCGEDEGEGPTVRRTRGPSARRDEEMESALASAASSLRIGCPSFAAPFLSERGGEDDSVGPGLQIRPKIRNSVGSVGSAIINR